MDNNISNAKKVYDTLVQQGALSTQKDINRTVFRNLSQDERQIVLTALAILQNPDSSKKLNDQQVITFLNVLKSKILTKDEGITGRLITNFFKNACGFDNIGSERLVHQFRVASMGKENLNKKERYGIADSFFMHCIPGKKLEQLEGDIKFSVKGIGRWDSNGTLIEVESHGQKATFYYNSHKQELFACSNDNSEQVKQETWTSKHDNLLSDVDTAYKNVINSSSRILEDQISSKKGELNKLRQELNELHSIADQTNPTDIMSLAVIKKENLNLTNFKFENEGKLYFADLVRFNRSMGGGGAAKLLITTTDQNNEKVSLNLGRGFEIEQDKNRVYRVGGHNPRTQKVDPPYALTQADHKLINALNKAYVAQNSQELQQKINKIQGELTVIENPTKS
ncbi:MAG: hypothetical protein H0T62_04175 [Parachlamydiaceae bacterium]|nr:hypothetical protein [Parachlamydiaceae bacterium]